MTYFLFKIYLLWYHTIIALIRAHGAYYISFWVKKGGNNLKESASLKGGHLFYISDLSSKHVVTVN